MSSSSVRNDSSSIDASSCIGGAGKGISKDVDDLKAVKRSRDESDADVSKSKKKKGMDDNDMDHDFNGLDADGFEARSEDEESIGSLADFIEPDKDSDDDSDGEDKDESDNVEGDGIDTSNIVTGRRTRRKVVYEDVVDADELEDELGSESEKEEKELDSDDDDFDKDLSDDDSDEDDSDFGLESDEESDE